MPRSISLRSSVVVDGAEARVGRPRDVALDELLHLGLRQVGVAAAVALLDGPEGGIEERADVVVGEHVQPGALALAAISPRA